MHITIRKPYDGKRHKKSISFLDSEGNQAIGRTKQAPRDETDINLILRKYDKTGLITHINASAAQYGDFTQVNEYQQNLNAVIQAQNSFDELPSEIRKKFANDPGNFFEFITDPKNAEEMVNLGLANPPQPAELVAVETPAATE